MTQVNSCSGFHKIVHGKPGTFELCTEHVQARIIKRKEVFFNFLVNPYSACVKISQKILISNI